MLYLQLHVGLTRVLFTAINGFAAEYLESSCCWKLGVGALIFRAVPLAALLGLVSVDVQALTTVAQRREAELRAYVSRRNPALALQMKRLKTLTPDNYKRKMNLLLDQKLLCKRVCKLWCAS